MAKYVTRTIKVNHVKADFVSMAENKVSTHELDLGEYYNTPEKAERALNKMFAGIYKVVRIYSVEARQQFRRMKTEVFIENSEPVEATEGVLSEIKATVNSIYEKYADTDSAHTDGGK